MKKLFLYTPLITILLASCVSQKKFTELQAIQDTTVDQLNSATVKLNTCDEEKAAALASVASLQEQIRFLKENNSDLIDNLGNLTTLSQKGAENLEKSLESLKEKDTRISSLRDAVTKKDSVTLALVTSLKGVLGNLGDEDIEVNVEKGVVGKVAKVVLDKPELEFMVEGHTDNVPISNDCVTDNWDLSVKRATSVVRVLQNDFNIPPQRMTAAGRSSYAPLLENDSPSNRSKNRRTRIVVLPKLDQFYDLINKGMEAAQ